MPRVPRRLRHVSANHVELVLSLVEIPETEPERNTRDEGNDSGSTIVPWINAAGLNEHQNTTKGEKRIEIDEQIKCGSLARGFIASHMALEMAFMKKKTAMTSDRILLGAFVNAYSRPVINANISENAMRT